jgi:DnaJ-class molecular chaperone
LDLDKTRALARRGPQAIVEEPYDDEQDHNRCADCKGSGYYVGFTDRRHCPTCEGSGWV